jgi:hypothetical protein
MRKSKQQDELAPINRDNLDTYSAAAESVVRQLRELLSDHWRELNHSASGTETQAARDPNYAGRVHRLLTACDGFSNAVRGVW